MSGLSWTRRLTLSLRAIAPGGGRRLAGKDHDGNLFFEKPDPNGITAHSTWSPLQSILFSPDIRHLASCTEIDNARQLHG